MAFGLLLCVCVAGFQFIRREIVLYGKYSRLGNIAGMITHTFQSAEDVTVNRS